MDKVARVFWSRILLIAGICLAVIVVGVLDNSRSAAQVHTTNMPKGPRAKATCAGPGTSCAVTVTPLALTVASDGIVQCTLGATGAPIIITAISASGSPITTLTMTYASASAVTCTVM